MEYAFNNRIVEPYLYSRNSVITAVNKEFIDLTGFEMDELIGKSLIDIGAALKINSQVLLTNINNNFSGFIFTKLLEAREVNISLFHDLETSEKIYCFKEKPNSRINDKLIFVEEKFLENAQGVAVYSVPDLILLKVNQKYLDFQNSPLIIEENSLGRPVSKILTGFAGSNAEVLWNRILETQKTNYIKEFRYDKFASGVTYWDYVQRPIFENKKMRYIFVTITEVTERVLNNQSLDGQDKMIQQQKELLKLQNTQLAGIIENLSEGLMLTDNKGEFIMANTEAKRLIYQWDTVTVPEVAPSNVKYSDMEGKEIPFENMPRIRALRGERVKNAKMFVSNKDKGYFVDNSSTPIYDANGDLTMVVSCFHDITEAIEQSKKIAEQKKELEAIIENISDGISIFDDKEQYILFNKSAREIFFPSYENVDKTGNGIKQSELLSIDGEEINPEDIPARRVMRGEKFKNMRMAVKFPYKTLQIDISGTPIYDSEGKFSLGVLCSRDMTDYFKHEEAERNRYEFLYRMIDTFDLPVVRVSCQDLKVVDINKKATSIIESFRSEVNSICQIKDNKIEDIFENFKTSVYYQCISEVLKEKKTKYLMKKNHVLNGNDIYWNVIFEPVLEVDGEVQEILILIIDVTNEIKSNIIMEKALELQEELFANISHELKTPLNVIFSTVQLLSLYCNSDSLEEMKGSLVKYVDSIKQNCHRLSKLINNIVDVSKIEAGFFALNLSNNNIVEVVEEIVMSVINFTEVKGINLIFDTDTEEKVIACDPEKIERIVLNLISNAIKFSEVGDEIFVNIKDKNEFVEISVTDNGIGLEVNHLEMIFDRFKQVNKSLSRNAEGTGIGLSLVKSIVELHGGHINVESEFGKGSKFTVILPSRNVAHENAIYSNKIINRDESIQVELSDICS
ncbi:MAG: PAS domain-containing sensor histidine kinase [Clostridiaceae bacterium]|nr:PAS domain-containing sensor histidine kinase [Clostridiaceae bacterium]